MHETLQRPSRADAGELEALAAKVEDGRRITVAEALFLHEHADVAELARLADLVRARLHPHGVVTYIVDRNLNPTNVCITDCGFCAFYRRPNHAEAYVLLALQMVVFTSALGPVVSIAIDEGPAGRERYHREVARIAKVRLD